MKILVIVLRTFFTLYIFQLIARTNKFRYTMKEGVLTVEIEGHGASL
jgi:hypothetical protein